MYREYKDKIEFFIIYVSEAHKNQLKQLGCNEKAPVTLEEKAVVARKFVKDVIEGKEVTIPILVGDMDGVVEKAYTPLPARTVIVDKEGKIVFNNGPSPGGSKEDKTRRALETFLGVEPKPRSAARERRRTR